MERQYITRCGYCEKCHANGFPIQGQRILLYGSKGFYVHDAEVYRRPDPNPTQVGFTPHLYKFIKSVGNKVTAHRICCVDKCAIDIKFVGNNKYDFFILDSSWEKIEMSIADWNALTNFKRDPNYIV